MKFEIENKTEHDEILLLYLLLIFLFHLRVTNVSVCTGMRTPPDDRAKTDWQHAEEHGQLDE